jgi:ribulose-phosphate 3-epimerase
MVKIAPSILSANFANLSQDIKSLDEAGADLYHIDVMDGHFVPNLTFGLKVISEIRHLTQKIFDVHLMVDNPQSYFEDLRKANVNMVSFHFEATKHHNSLLQHLKKLDLQAGIALNPSTPIHMLDDIIEDLDFILIMSVNPGFGGQKFLKNTFKKLNDLNNRYKVSYPNLQIQVDGGVDETNIAQLKKLNIDIAVAGTSVFKNNDLKNNIELLKNK